MTWQVNHMSTSHVRHSFLLGTPRRNQQSLKSNLGFGRKIQSVRVHSLGAIQLIVTDVDGTLLTDGQELTERTVTAIRRAEKEKNVPLMIATGKACGPWTEKVLPALASPMPQIFLQGLFIRDALGNVMYSNALESRVVERVVDIAKELDVTLVLYSNDRILCQQTDCHTDRLIFYGEPIPEPVGDVISYLVNNKDVVIYKCIFMADDECIKKRVRPYLEKKLSSSWQELEGSVSLTSALEGMVEILPGGSSKGAGVKFVLETLGMQPDRVMAMGDGENDMEMIQMVGLGIAVANATPLLKQNARVTSPYTNNQEAVAQSIEKYILHA